MRGEDGDAPQRALLIAALVIAVAALGAVLAVAVTRRTPPRPVAIAAVPAPQAESAECRSLTATLPDRLGVLNRATPADPVPPGAAAWGPAEPGADPVIMRCGLDRPAEFVVGSALQMVDDVQWFRIADPGTDRTTWVAVDRPVYVALTLPSASGPDPIQTLSGVLARTLPAIPIRPAPVG